PRRFPRILVAAWRGSTRRTWLAWDWKLATLLSWWASGRPSLRRCRLTRNCVSRHIQIDGITRENTGSAIDQLIEVRKATVRQAERVVLTPLGYVPADRDLEYIGSLFDGLPVLAEDRVRATLFGNRSADFKVASTNPSGPVVIKPRTVLEIARSPSG